MSDAVSTDAVGADAVRADVGAARRRQRWRWGLATAALLGLLSVYSEGLFLYAAAVVGLALAVSILIATTSLHGLEVARRLSATEIAYGDVVDAWLTVHNRKALRAPGLVWRDQVDPGKKPPRRSKACRCTRSPLRSRPRESRGPAPVTAAGHGVARPEAGGLHAACARHPDSAAGYQCYECGRLLCPQCVKVGSHLIFCGVCGERAVDRPRRLAFRDPFDREPQL